MSNAVTNVSKEQIEDFRTNLDKLWIDEVTCSVMFEESDLFSVHSNFSLPPSSNFLSICSFLD